MPVFQYIVTKLAASCSRTGSRLMIAIPRPFDEHLLRPLSALNGGWTDDRTLADQIRLKRRT